MMHDTVVILVEDRGKILLVKRLNRTFRGWWCLPGGHAEPGETPEQAAQREAREEVGNVEVEKKPFLVFVHDWPADNHIKEPHQHKCHAFRGRATNEIRAGSDAGEIRWLAPEEANRLELTDYTKRVLIHTYK